MRDQEIHGNVFTICVLVNFAADSFRHDIGVQISIILQKRRFAKCLGT